MNLCHPPRHNQSGFSVFEASLVLLVVAALAVTGFVVYRRQASTGAKSSATARSVQTTTQPAPTPTGLYAGWHTYTSGADHFSVMYPPTWTLDPQNGPYGEVGYDSATLTSPSKTVLNLYANTGGKGGWCTPAPQDVPFRKGNACSTFEYLTSEQLPVNNLYYMADVPNSNPVKFMPTLAPVYLVTTHFADQNGVSSYGISIAETTTPKDTFALNTPYIGSNPP